LQETAKNSAAQIEAQVKKNREDARQAEERNMKVINDAVERGRNRAFLSAPSGNLLQIQGIRNALALMEESGMSKKEARNTLTEEQRALADEADFIEAKKQQYGKKDKRDKN
jgi:hypothetical protein